MPNKIQIKRTSITGRTPNTTSSGNSSFIDTGELALNITDGKLFSSNGLTYFEVGGNLQSLSVTSGLTANATLVNAVALNVVNQTNTSTLFVTTSANVGTIFTVNSSALVVNSTTATGTLIKVSHTSTGNILVIEDESSETSPLVIDASGYLVLGSNTAPVIGTVGTHRITAAGAAADLASIAIFRNDETSAPGTLGFGKTRVATTNLAINDVVGRIEAAGNDGTDNRSPLTRIEFAVDGVTSLDDMPGRITFSTTADGAATVTERMRIDSAGLTTVNSNLYVVTSANVASAFLTNSTGMYHTGVARAGGATSRIILGTGMGVSEAGMYVTSNSTLSVIQGEFQGSSYTPIAINPNGGAVRLAGTFGTTNGVNVTNVSIVVGNSVANATLSNNVIQIANSTSTANLTPTTLAIGSITVNSALANLQALNVVNQTNTATLYVTTSANVGTAFTVNSISVNSTVNTSILAIIANGSIGTSGQVLTSNATGIYWSTVSGGGGSGASLAEVRKSVSLRI